MTVNFADFKTRHETTEQGMEGLMETGKVKSIGLANFNHKQVTEVWDIAKIKPVNLQVRLKHQIWKKLMHYVFIACHFTAAPFY